MARLSPKPASFSCGQAATAQRSGTRWRCAGRCQKIIGTDRAALLPHYLLIILVWSADPAVCVSGWHEKPVAPGGTKILPRPTFLPFHPLGNRGRDKPVEVARLWERQWAKWPQPDSGSGGKVFMPSAMRGRAGNMLWRDLWPLRRPIAHCGKQRLLL